MLSSTPEICYLTAIVRYLNGTRVPALKLGHRQPVPITIQPLNTACKHLATRPKTGIQAALLASLASLIAQTTRITFTIEPVFTFISCMSQSNSIHA